jgi:hypothetical protein
MTTVEMEAKKARLVRYIINIDSEEIINEISVLVDSLSSMPCRHTVRELKEGLPEFINRFEHGELIPHEEIERKTV